MPNSVRKASSAHRPVHGATLCPRALAPLWTMGPSAHRRRPRVRAPPERKPWRWFSAGSKGRERRTAGPKTSRSAPAQSQQVLIKFMFGFWVYSGILLFVENDQGAAVVWENCPSEEPAALWRLTRATCKYTQQDSLTLNQLLLSLLCGAASRRLV